MTGSRWDYPTRAGQTKHPLLHCMLSQAALVPAGCDRLALVLVPQVVLDLPRKIIHVVIDRDLFANLVRAFEAFDVVGQLESATTANLEMASFDLLVSLW